MLQTVEHTERKASTHEVDRAADAALLARLRAKDESAFASIMAAWSPVMLHMARRYVADHAAAEDVVQETWLGVIKGLSRFEGRSSLRSWTFSILLNQARTRGYRDRRVLPTATLGGVDAGESTVDPARFQGIDDRAPGHWTSTGAPRAWEEPERRALGREAGALLRAGLEQLPERQRLVVEMRDVLGMGSGEVCAAMDVSPENQRVLLHRARAALRALLDDYHSA